MAPIVIEISQERDEKEEGGEMQDNSATCGRKLLCLCCAGEVALSLQGVRAHYGIEKLGSNMALQDGDVLHDAMTADCPWKIPDRGKEGHLVIE